MGVKVGLFIITVALHLICAEYLEFDSGEDEVGRKIIGNLWDNLRSFEGNYLIPYRLSHSVANTPEAKKLVSSAVLDYHRKTCIRFVKYTPQLHQDLITFEFRPEGKCWTARGRRGGNQPVYFNLNCPRPLTGILFFTLGVSFNRLGEDFAESKMPDVIPSSSENRLRPLAVLIVLKAYKCFQVLTTQVPTTSKVVNCGQPYVKPQNIWPKVVGGYAVIPGSHPWQVSLRFKENDFAFCGGVVINEWWILSATHCFFRGTDPNLYAGYVGKHHMSQVDPGEVRVTFSKLISHANFVQETFRNDISLLKVDSPIEMTITVRPICLPSSLLDLPTWGTMLLVTGWGETLNTGDRNVLRQVRVPLLDPFVCTLLLPAVKRGQICAGYLKGGKDSCHGDSGGPLIEETEAGKYSLIGIVSWGKNCAEPRKPGVYTNVAYYLDWILYTVNSN